MTKPFFTILGLSLAMVLASGCGKGFDAVKSVPGAAGLPKPQPPVPPPGPAPAPAPAVATGVSDQEAETARQRAEAETAAREQALKDKVKKHNDDVANASKKLVFIDVNELADKMITAVSLNKVGGILNLSAVVKSDDSEQAADMNIVAALPIIGDEVLGFTEQGTLQVNQLNKAAGEKNESQYQVLYVCVDGCRMVTVRVQRVLGEKTEANGTKIAQGYAASFTFMFAEKAPKAEGADANAAANVAQLARLVQTSVKKTVLEASPELIKQLGLGQAVDAGAASVGDELSEVEVTAKQKLTEVEITAQRKPEVPAPASGDELSEVEVTAKQKLTEVETSAQRKPEVPAPAVADAGAGTPAVETSASAATSANVGTPRLGDSRGNSTSK